MSGQAVRRLIVGISGVYLLASSSVQNAFDNVVSVTGLLFSIFYILTALTLVVYYRRLITRSVRDAIVLGVLPLAAAGFLGWVLVLSLYVLMAGFRRRRIEDPSRPPGSSSAP